MFAPYLGLWPLCNHSLLGSRSRHWLCNHSIPTITRTLEQTLEPLREKIARSLAINDEQFLVDAFLESRVAYSAFVFVNTGISGSASFLRFKKIPDGQFSRPKK